MTKKSRRILAAAVAGLLSGSTSVFATNGSFMIGSGAGSIGMGGVGATSPQDSMCVGGNPACLGELERPQMDVGAALFRPPRAAATTVLSGDGSYVRSDVNLYLMPSFGFVWPFNDQLSFGVAALPAGGGGVTFGPGKGIQSSVPANNNFFSGSNYLGTDLVQLIVPITVSYKANDTNTFGISVIPARQRFLAQGLDNFRGFSSDPDHLTNKGHDYANGIGARIGWMGYYFDKSVTLGATYASKVVMQKFELYKGLFAEGGSFDIPANYTVGIGVKPIENLTLALDVHKILYSDVPAFANRGPDSSGNLNVDPSIGETSLGMANGAGFGWVDQTIYKVGVAYRNVFPSIFGEDKLTLRAGFNYGKMPIQKEQLLFSTLATATTEKHITFGFTYSLGEQSIFGFGSEGALTFAGMHAFNKRIEGRTVGTSGELGWAGMEMKQSSWELAYTLKF